MIKNQYKKWIIFALGVIFIATCITTQVLENNSLHTDHCDIDNCPMCNLINISTNLINKLDIILISILIYITNVPLVKLVITKIVETHKNTLIELKVVQIK
ncbi:MAG: hypothetical protein IJV31_03985 [Clostridia bacterium]|nr:hypothetical protein [Clostridia bacterium]